MRNIINEFIWFQGLPRHIILFSLNTNYKDLNLSLHIAMQKCQILVRLRCGKNFFIKRKCKKYMSCGV